MLVKLIAPQIPVFWDTIKYCCQKADTVKVDNYQQYFVELLHALLSDKAQCFVRLDDEKRTILALLVTRIIVDKMTGEKNIFLQSGYSFQRVDTSIWVEDFKKIIEIAKNKNCSGITFESSNPKLIEYAHYAGFEEKNRTFEYRIGGA